MTKTSQIWIGTFMIILAFLVGVIIFFAQATSPYTQAKADAIRLAKEKTSVKTVTNFSITTTKTSTCSLIGVDADNQIVGVLIPAEGGEIITVKLSDNKSNLTEKTAKLTLYKGKVVWQTAELALFDFETGKEIKQ
ncbi:hypothetical protein Hs30E_03980 [Lactococcus hodotermopsidis]|uniref:Cell wall elongation regulator TseB-like domain-containing protein n=2 Tax=Pseudolactococcus hodotermopsidis TaxID=2709157 RepID=A0A6A0BDF0_9LACT|nr:hypothetical protein Hs30E_03980 [Lactococcus hodotermopsidis]